MAWGDLIQGCLINLYWGFTRVWNEALTQDPVETDTWWFANSPVSTKDLRLVGTEGADSEFIVNFDLEPLSGRLTIAAAVDQPGGFDSISASYFYYLNVEVSIITKNYKVEFPRLTSEVDIFAQPHYQVHNAYPHKVTFKIALTEERQRNLLSEAVFRAAYFIMLDKGIGTTYGVRAYEGPLWSDEQSSINKGMSYMLPIELMCQQFGSVRAEATGLVEATWDAGGGETNVTSTGHGLVTGQWVTISGTTSYNGTWQIENIGAVTFRIKMAFVGNETGEWIRNEEIRWGFWEN